ncbi:hypothetical protein ABB37_00160 [Leptomonas pyrrhocoris]|uniref:Uncharacterized protein n=1 Tax=Leptomonas pyrrhocoris TaxID=157538 RepID=A0A0N0VHN3_LEPPY|nr:hypothetical protein ABB37_00160 [Leptomonas pyrrhocoris]KPA85821.1 hypothetical protein ABB37_00160 [Leptomonas pyrrhocoris]|eukprot:XP_015664260.1 hypothetical protein ABB37_00160 [Leptomonas pyrrhocoris]
MLIIRKLVESAAVNAVCVLQLENGLSVLLAAISESVHVYDICLVDGAPSSSSTAYDARPRGHVFHVGCGVVSLLALANQCVFLWTRDQECIIVRYQANLATALVDPRVVDSDHVYRPSGEPSPVHYKEHHWYVVERLRLWCPDACASLHSPELGVNDSVEMVHLRFCSEHVFFVCIKWERTCVPGRAAATSSTALSNNPSVPSSASVPSLVTTRWHTCDYMRLFAENRFPYPTQNCSVATRRPGESAEAHQQRIEQLWQSGSTFANVLDEDLIATHAVMELSKRKTAATPTVLAALSTGPEKVDWCGVQAVTVHRETYSSPSPLMPTPAFYCNARQGGFTNVRIVSGRAAVYQASLDLSTSKSTAVKDDYAADRIGALAVSSPRRASRRGLDWTLLAFLTSTSHTAIYHLQRARTPLGTPQYVLDGLFSGPLRVQQVLFCTHSGDASNDVWVALDSGVVTRFSIAALRARSADARDVRNVHLYPWPETAIAGLPATFLCRRLLPADTLFHPIRGSEGVINNGASANSSTGVKNGSLSVYPCTKRYALLSDCVQDVYVVDLVERRVVAALAGDGPMTDVCEAPHGYVAAFARGVLRYFQPGMQLHVRGTVRLPPFGMPIRSIYAARVTDRRTATGATSASSPGVRVEAGVYVMMSTHHTSQLYRVEDANMCACTSDAWVYEKNEATLAFDAVTEGHVAGALDGNSPTVLVQCTPTRCVFGSTVHRLPSPLVRAVVTVVPGVGAVCVGAFCEAALAGTHLSVAVADAGVCTVDVATKTGVSLGFPACLTARGMTGASVEVLVGRWDGCVTVLELQRAGEPAAWRCVASQTIQAAFGTASPVQQFLPLPRAGVMSRWMAAHSSGEVSILALARKQQTTGPSSTEAEQEEKECTGGAGWVFSWAPTSPPYRRAQQKVTCAMASLVRAPVDAAKDGEEEKEVYNGFDGALLQPRDGALLFFSVPLEEGDTQAPPHMQRLRERDEEDGEWVVRLENTVRAIVPPDATGQVRAAPWRCAVLLETITADGTLRYDALVVQQDEITLCTLDTHLFAKPYPRPRATLSTTNSSPSSSSTTAPSAGARHVPLPPPPTRAHVLACTAPSRYICTHRLQLPQLNPHETLVSIAREPDDEGEGVLLCVTVCDQTSLTRLTTLHSGTLAVLDSFVLHESIAHWMSAVPPSTPRIARAAPLFLMCSENTHNGTVELQVVAAHPLRIASSETLEDSPGWLDVVSSGVSVDGAVQVVPTRINSEGDTYGGEVLVTVTVDYAIHLFVLRGYTLLFQHCVLAPACTTSVTLCYPIVTVCTEGDSNVYLQVYPVNDDTEVFAPSYSEESTKPLKKYGKVSWKMRVSMREPTFGASVLAQAPLYDRCVRTDVEGDVTVMFITLAPANSKTRSAAHIKGEDSYVGSAEGPQTFLTHAVRLPTVPVKARVLRHVAPIQRRYPRQLQCSGHNYHLQSSSVRKDCSSRLLLLPCHDGSLYGALEIPYGFAHPLMRLEQVITDAYALDLSVDVNPSAPAGVLQYTYHLRPFRVARALQPLTGMRQAEKQACVMADAVFEYFLLRDLVQNGYGAVASSSAPALSTPSCRRSVSHAPAATGAVDVPPESDAAVVRRKFTALDDVVQTLLTEEYGDDFTVDTCAEMLNVL